MKNALFVAVLTILVSIGFGCSEESEQVVIPPKGTFRSLEARDDVLFNLEMAYNQWNVDEVDKLLDPDFIFHFSLADIQNGNINQARWDRANEVAATRSMFNTGTLPPNVDPISDISLALFFTDGGDNWNAVPPLDPLKYAGETWYRQRIDYFLTIVAGENTYTSGNPMKVEFTLRPTGVNGKTVWRVVSWQDVGEVAALRSGPLATSATSNATWGAIKSLYHH